MSRTYCGTALGGTTPDSSIGPGSIAAAVSMVTMSPQLMVSTGFTLAAKWPICTVCGLGISVYSAACAGGAPAVATSSEAPAIGRNANMRDLRDEAARFDIRRLLALAGYPIEGAKRRARPHRCKPN